MQYSTTIELSVYLLLSLMIAIIIGFHYKKINKSLILSPNFTGYLNFGISILTVLTLHKNGYIPNYEFITIIYHYSVFFCFLILTPYLISRRLYTFEKLKVRSIDIVIAKTFTLIGGILTTIYAYILWTKYSTGDERLLLNKEMRALSIIHSVFFTWASSLLSFVYAKTLRKKYIILLLILWILGTFSGSKGALLGNFLIFLFFYFQFNKVSRTKLSIIFFVSIIFLFLPSLLMYKNNFFWIIVNRIINSGDIYLLSFKLGDYRSLVGYYDPLRYIIHPFSSIFGFRGYDFPIGAKILETAGLPVTGTGPNPHLPILHLVLLNDCTLCILNSAVWFGLLSTGSVLFSFWFLTKEKFKLYFRIYIFVLFYTSQTVIFFDIGFFEFNIIYAILSFFIYIIIEFLRKISIKNDAN